MELSPEAQKVLNDLIVILVPILAAIVSAWFAGWKNRRDTNAAFKKIRAHEEYMGIETKVTKGEVHVTSRATGEIVHSKGPQGLSEKGSA